MTRLAGKRIATCIKPRPFLMCQFTKPNGRPFAVVLYNAIHRFYLVLTKITVFYIIIIIKCSFKLAFMLME